ncbi:C2H2-type zinc finger protein [Candidatus Woesearchaeota archaeon]|nr:C2H2-type zinc finger protein [Candidatus Woesearchaeota archaeon]
MTEEHKCKECEKTFTSADALNMHNRAKHPALYKAPKLTTAVKKKIRNWSIAVIFVALAFWGIIALLQQETPSQNLNVMIKDASHIPKGAIHWHPHLKISIDGKEQRIPTNIGISTGKIVDTHLSGMQMSPLHTHENDGIIHLENNNPSTKPETTTLGYFFYVWDKKFSKECIFDYCTDKGTLTMTVNGKENTDFENYLMRDGDEIVITYISNSGSAS